MEFDLSKEERQFIIDALDSYLAAYPEYAESMERLSHLIHVCGEVGTTLHLN